AGGRTDRRPRRGAPPARRRGRPEGMARLRLTAALAAGAVAAAAFAGCGRAGAAPDQASGLTPPAGWQPLPPVAAAARAALGAEVEGAEAFGEPAMGCYAVWVALRASSGAEALAKQVVDGFTAAAGSGAGAKTSEPSRPEEPGSGGRA